MSKLFSKIGRYAFCIIFLVVVFLLFEYRLFEWQIVNGQVYADEALNQSTDHIKLNAARGEILDANGVVLAGNKTSYSVKFNALTMDLPNRNQTIIKLLALLEEQEEVWNDSLPILLDEEGNYVFNESMPGEIEYLKSSSMLNLQEYATADDCIEAMISRYNAAGYSNKVTRDLLSVRYSMTKIGFGRTTPCVIANNISSETLGIINERNSDLPGVETDISVSRYYGEDGSMAPHIVGYIGAMWQEDLERAEQEDNLYSSDNLSGYAGDDTIGREGIEKAFESELRGQNGKAVVVTDNEGKMTGTTVVTQAEPGNTVHLTLDTGLQQVANESLKENILGNTENRSASIGAVVALDVKTFGVLASASYPTYDMNEYTGNSTYYNQLIEDDDKPLFNRALDGAFAPGSVFKPLVAIAALQEKTISAGTTVFCSGVYTHFNDGYEPKCLGVHDYEDVYGALRDSCNVFFYDTGRLLGIDKMSAYASYFALGEKTGIELNESSGLMSNRTDYLRLHGTPWTDGNTVNAAIGQLDNSFTPMQLATYCATIANNGVRLQTHFLDKVTDYTGEELVYQHEPVEVADAGISGDVLGVVRQGMIMAAASGTARYVFADYPVSVAAKTGTAETYNNNPDHLTFIAYAPADDPQIAVAVVMEYGRKGNWAMNVARDIFDEYFGIERNDDDNDEGDGTSSESSDPEDPEESAAPLQENGETASVGAFYDPEKDLVSSKREDDESSSDMPVG